MPILNVNHLSKVYGSKQKYKALHDINFSVDKGEFVAIMGPSGSVRLPSSMSLVPSIVFLEEL